MAGNIITIDRNGKIHTDMSVDEFNSFLNVVFKTNLKRKIRDVLNRANVSLAQPMDVDRVLEEIIRNH
jgi:hypothetical protein